MKLTGYVRVSTDGQHLSGLGEEAQRGKLRYYAGQEGHELERIELEVISTRKRQARLEAILDELRARAKAGEDVGLIVSRIDRLGRSLGHIAAVIERAGLEGWGLVCLDPRIDTSSPYGRAMAHMAAVFAQLERDLISQRTKEGLAVARSQGRVGGRRTQVADGTRRLILDLHSEGWSVRRIARRLEQDGISPPEAGRWHSSTVHHIIKRAAQAAHRR